MDQASRLRRVQRSRFDDHDERGHGESDRDSGELHDAIGNSGVQRLASAGAQAKLEVGGADDAYEQEADQVADEVMGGPVAQPARAIEGGATGVQREGGGAGFAASDEVSASIDGATGGQSLDGDVRDKMEAKTGASFEGVRVHDDAEAHATTAAVGAHAFTHGRDIHFAKGAYDPGSKAGKHLLAHELTHVVQQSGGQTAGVQRKAISAAPSSVQRNAFGNLLSGIGNLFGGKKKTEEEKEHVAMPGHSDMMDAQNGVTREQRDHYAQWNADNDASGKGNLSTSLYIAKEQYVECFAEMEQHAVAAAKAAMPDETDVDALVVPQSVLGQAYEGRFTSGLVDELLQRFGADDTVAEHAHAYQATYSRARTIIAAVDSWIQSGDLNVDKAPKTKFKARCGADELNPKLIAEVPADPAGVDYSSNHPNYEKDEAVQDHWRKSGWA